MNAGEMIQALGGDPATGKAHCPAHDDQKKSLSLTERDGKTLWKCHAGCSQEAVTSALRERGLLGGGKGSIVATYDYTDAQGKLLFQVVRFEPKDFRQRRPDGKGGWIWNVPKEMRVLYHLPELRKAIQSGQRVFVVEGEKDVNLLAKLGLPATCNPGGAGKWDARYSESLKWAQTAIIPDNDGPGLAHAEMVAGALQGIAHTVKVIRLPGLPPKGDVAVWLDQGGAAEDLKTLAVSVQEWRPGDLSGLAPPPESSDAIAEMNGQYAFVMLGGKAAIIIEADGPGAAPTFTTRSELAQKFANRTTEIQTGEGRKTVPLFNHWWRSPERREYSRVDFLPDRKPPDGVYNLWRGFAVEAKEGDCSLYFRLIEDGIAKYNPAIGEYILNWFAHAVQKPWEKPGTALAFPGKQGVGKGSLVLPFGALFGCHFLHADSPERITGRFNMHLAHKIVLFADEAFFAGDPRTVGILKARITEPELTFEAKGKDPITLPNYHRIIAASNQSWMVPAGLDERRWAVFEISDRFRGDHEFWRAFHGQMNSGGREALFHHLLNRDLSRFNIQDYPQTEALKENQIASMNPIEGWWFDCLLHGRIMESDESWPGRVNCERALDSLKEYVAHHPRRVAVNNTNMGTSIRKLCGVSSQQKWDGPAGRNRKGYDLPDLNECRARFEQATGFRFDWPKDGGGYQSGAVEGAATRIAN